MVGASITILSTLCVRAGCSTVAARFPRRLWLCAKTIASVPRRRWRFGASPGLLSELWLRLTYVRAGFLFLCLIVFVFILSFAIRAVRRVQGWWPWSPPPSIIFQFPFIGLFARAAAHPKPRLAPRR